MKLYIVLYHHRHGVTACVIHSITEPTEEEMYEALEAMGEDIKDRREDEYVETFLAPSFQKGHALNEEDCDSAGCPGWLITTDNDKIERCDNCKRFENDDMAVAHVHALEALDWGQHFEAAAHKALVALREDLSGLVESTQDYPASPEMTEIVGRLETLLGRSFWLERHRWSEHGLQFARLLSEMYSIGEPSEDSETMEERGFLSIKIKELEESMDMSWDQILSIMERADIVFQGEKRPPEVES
jgi:hypothetical protein